ncbi:MAG: hypothetical protein ACYCW6_19195 [Candidatus Xenobia bacterium]
MAPAVVRPAPISAPFGRRRMAMVFGVLLMLTATGGWGLTRYQTFTRMRQDREMTALSRFFPFACGRTWTYARMDTPGERWTLTTLHQKQFNQHTYWKSLLSNDNGPVASLYLSLEDGRMNILGADIPDHHLVGPLTVVQMPIEENRPWDGTVGELGNRTWGTRVHIVSQHCVQDTPYGRYPMLHSYCTIGDDAGVEDVVLQIWSYPNIGPMKFDVGGRNLEMFGLHPMVLGLESRTP